jgi:hypothetical protein
MPTDLADANTGRATLLFADDLQGTDIRLRETAVYEAEEVQSQIDSGIPRYGTWLPVETPDDAQAWAVALGELVGEMQQLDDPTGGMHRIVRCEKSGTKQTDHYDVDVEAESGGGQTGLPD